MEVFNDDHYTNTLTSVIIGQGQVVASGVLLSSSNSYNPMDRQGTEYYCCTLSIVATVQCATM